MNLFAKFSFVLTAALLTPNFAAAEKILHIGVISVYEQPDNEQFKRMDAQLKASSPTAEVVSIRNEVLRTKFEDGALKIREVDSKILGLLNGTHEVFDQVVVQADARDYLHFWQSFDRGEVIFGQLLGHLAPNARIIFTGGPALGPVDKEGFQHYQGRVPQLLERFGVPAATFVVAVSPVHVKASRAEAWGRRITTAIGLGLAGAGGVAASYIPREQMWINYLIPVGGVFWMSGAVIVDNLIERFTNPKYNPKELINIKDVFRLEHVAIGSGLTALAGGLWYSGTGIIDQKFMLWSAGYAAVLGGIYAYYEKGEQIWAFLKREKRPVNDGLAFARQGGGVGVTKVKMDAPGMYSCTEALSNGVETKP